MNSEKLSEARACLLRGLSLLDEAARTGTPPVAYVDQDDVEELAARKLSRRSFLEAARRGDFPTEKIGRRVRANVAELDGWLSSCRRAPRPKLALVPSEDAARQALASAAARFARKGSR